MATQEAARQGTLLTILEAAPANDTALVLPGGPRLTYSALLEQVQRTADTLASYGLGRAAQSGVHRRRVPFLSRRYRRQGAYRPQGWRARCPQGDAARHDSARIQLQRRWCPHAGERCATSAWQARYCPRSRRCRARPP